MDIPGLALLAGVSALGLLATTGLAAEDDDASWLDQADYRYLLKLQTSATQQEPADSSLNPNNDVLQLPALSLNGQVRLDVNAELAPVSFLIKPRFVADAFSWDEGALDGESESDTEFYINEWQLRLAIADEVYTSYGRENLQWGPSYLYSPSNPFIQDNGQNNPKRELPGLDFAKVLWVPSRDWSIGLMANLDEGEATISRNIDPQYDAFVRQVDDAAQAQVDFINAQYREGLTQIQELRNLSPGANGPIARNVNAQADALEAFAAQQRDAALAEVKRQSSDIFREAEIARDTYNREFQRQYAMKVDYTSLQQYATLITSYQETEAAEEDPRRVQLGGYGGVTASDALLLYAEASASLRGEELYPVADPDAPLGQRLVPARLDENDFRGVALAGGSYTFLNGQTIVAEYLYNGLGYNTEQAEHYYELRDAADDALLEPEPLSTLGLQTLGQAADVGMRFIRRNYVLLQYQQLQIVGDLGFALRSTFNLDDGSAQLIPILQYNFGDRWQTFAIISRNVGRDNTEFTSVYSYAYQLGIELTL